MAQYTQRTQPMHRPGQTDHGVGGGALAYGGGKGPQRAPAAPYPAQPYPPLRLHQPGYGSAALTFRDGSYRGGGGAVGEYRAGVGVGVGARMSLLGAAYLPPPAPPALHPPPADPPPYKKIRITQDRSNHPQLRVDTREPVNAYNTVEMLSPNPPSEPTVEDQSFRTTKDELLQQISKVDREMALSEATLSKLRKKQSELEQTASKPARAEEPEEAVPRHRSLAQCVYADNRKKAAAAHAMLSHLGPPIVYPLYNQPQDTEVYHENIRRNRGFRKRLADHIHRLKLEAEKREDALAEAYSRRAAEWMRRVERIEQGQKRKAKDARNRELFEKVFPELRKQREERERFNRLGARVKSEAELEEIADGLHEQEHEDKKMRSLTVVPPLLRHRGDTTPIYIDTNRRCMDMESEHKDLQLRNVWSRGEREMFRDKYLQHPKNFGQVASYLPRKSVRDCVRFYYLSKKAENYKQVLRKPRSRRPPRGPRPAPEPELPPGVTTRLQRSMGSTPRGDSKEGGMEEGGAEGGVAQQPPAAPLNAPARPELIRTPPLPPSPPPASSAPPAPVTGTSGTSLAGTPPPASEVPRCGTPPELGITTTPPAITTVTTACTTACTAMPLPTTPVTVSSPAACPNSAPNTPQPPQPDTAVTERTGTPSSIITTTTSDMVVVSSPPTTTAGSSACAVCNAPGATRTISRSRAAHYGLREDAAGARVCEPCHCRCVRSRYTRCPAPTCPGPRVRAKRLRHLPPRWHDLPLEVKRPLMDEFQIPSELSKCCLACFKRITRRLETVGEGGSAPEPTEEEASRFRNLIKEHGTAWDRMSSASGRTPASLKAFYFTYRKRFQLDALVAEKPAPKGSDTDDSILSSGDTDTASAESPRPPPLPGPRTDAVAPKGRRRDEYDSSATETADEENDAPSAKIIPTITLSTPISSESSTPPPVASTLSITTSTPGTPGAPITPGTPGISSTTSVAVTSVARNGPSAASQLTVRDVVLNMIEFSLLKNNQPIPPAPKVLPPKVSTPAAPRETLATLSVVSSSHVSSSPASPHRPATITPLQTTPPSQAQPQQDVKDGVVVVIEPRQEPLLDLSVKRPRRDLPASAAPAGVPAKPPYRNSTDYQYRPPERESPNQYNSKPKPMPQIPAPRPTLKPVPNPKGSITLGTPVENRFDARRTPPDPKTGSITAGTPVHHLPEKKSFDYYKRKSPGGPAYYAGVAPQPRPHSPSFSPNAGYPRPYLDNRQIIMTDFITSQQMHGGARRERPERVPSPHQPHPHPQHQQHHQQHHHQQQHQQHQQQHHQQQPQRRENVSVIQRHSYGHAVPHTPPPGHEAFKSLVEAAASATALPVPREAKPEPKHPPHHDISRISDRMQRDMAMAQKYHQHQQQMQQQYQVLERERDRRAQVQYLERDRQIQLQQNRERERVAMAALQERQIAMEQQHQHQQHQHQQHQQQQHHQQQQQQHHQQQQHQQQQSQMMHERHLQHQQIVSSQEERRILSGVTYSTAPKHRAITPLHVERKDARLPAVSCAPSQPQVSTSVVSSVGAPGPPAPPAPPAPPPGAGGADRPRPAEGTLTAASLIDAIITHQISQTSDQRYPSIIREESNPPPPEREPQRVPTASERERDREQRERERERDREEAAAAAAAHTTSMKLGDLASNIITRDFCSPTTSMLHHNSRFAVSDGYAAGTQHKHAPYLEPVSPPDTHPNNRNSTARRFAAVSGASTSTPHAGGSVLTAFDYVTNRIVEVMRSDADERKPLAFPTGAYAYPYSALSVAATPAPITDAAPASAAPAPPAAAAPEPAPLMSAQYEPLSDED